MPDTDPWTGFVAGLKEMEPHGFDDFTPVRVPRPRCPDTIEVCRTLRYRFDGSNLFLIDKPPQPYDKEPRRSTDATRAPWIRTTRTAPVRRPLGWSLVMGRPLFWLTDSLVLPAEIAAWVLWRHRRTGAVWRADDPGSGNADAPAAVWAGADATKPALAYLMPFAAREYPRWSELRHQTEGARRP